MMSEMIKMRSPQSYGPGATERGGEAVQEDDSEILLHPAGTHKDASTLSNGNCWLPNWKAGMDRSVYRRKFVIHILTSFLLVAQILATANYLVFKVRLHSRAWDESWMAPWLFLVLLCEFVYFISLVFAAVDHLLPPSARPELWLKGESLPTVHVLLTCCNEPTDVPQESIRAALAMDYPNDRLKVLVLDDGDDEELRAFCEAMQVEAGGEVAYLRRKKVPGVPHNFKCGNLNFGLEHSDAEYVVLLDADMILHPTFLRRLMPHIIDSPQVSFVQVPQSFYNLPPGDPLNDSCMMAYERVLVHRDSLGCASCVGTGAVFRREHLNVIGGFQPQSITEDTLTAFALFNQGFKSVYLKERLQIGLAPWTIQGYIKQRQRWGLGAFQLFAATWKSMLGWNSNLNFVLKMLFVWNTGYYYVFIANMILMGVLLSALAFHLNLTVGNADENRRLMSYLAVTLVIWRLQLISLWLSVPQSVLSRNRDESHIWWMTPFFFKMVFRSIFSWKSTFSFVPTSNIDSAAGGQSNQSAFNKYFGELRHVVFHMVYAAVVVTVVAWRGFQIFTNYGSLHCGESFFVIGVSMFLVTTAAHMLLPVTYILFPPIHIKPSERKSLLRYDADGVPCFDEGAGLPTWHWTVYIYEAMSLAILVFWTAVLYAIDTGLDVKFCGGDKPLSVQNKFEGGALGYFFGGFTRM